VVDILGIVLFFVGTFFVLGLPISLVLRRSSEGWVAYAADSTLYGFLFGTMTVTLYTWLGWFGLAMALTSWLGFVGGAVRRGEFPAQHGSPPRRALIVGWVALFAGAILLRLHSVNFLPWVGDMGAYINWANGWQISGAFASAWPPVTSVFLSLSSFIFGTAHTASIMPVAGIMLLIALPRLLQRIGLGPWVVFAATAFMAFQQHAVWYSSFPSSESLSLPLFLIWIIVILEVLVGSRWQLVPAWGVVALSTLSLCLLRGSGTLLLIPLIAVALLSLVVSPWKHLAGRFLIVLSAATTGAVIGFWYGITIIPNYYVTMQFRDILPSSLFEFLVSAGLTEPSPLLILILVAVPALFTGLALLREKSKKQVILTDSRILRVVQIFVVLSLVAGVVGMALIGATTWSILLRMSPLLLIGCGAVFLQPVFRKLTVPQQLIASLLMATSLMFLGLHTIRLGIGLRHAFFLYWDRYLVSEYLPAATALTAIALGALAPVINSRRKKIVASAIAVTIVAIPSAPSLFLQSQDTYMKGAYTFTRELIALAGDPTTGSAPGSANVAPIVWSGTSRGTAQGWFFPNTWMGFAVPMVRSFGLEVLNASQSQDNFAPDEVLTAGSLRDYARCSPDGTLVVFETQHGNLALDERVQDVGIVFAPLGTATSNISLLSQPADGGWTHANITVRAWEVSVQNPTPGTCDARRD
jgi:hypothetical protein